MEQAIALQCIESYCESYEATNDHALNRLAPSLRPYEGCTIIDVNPGNGLWSSKVHAIVKPKKHFLAEPPDSRFVPTLEELSKQEGSNYHLLDWPDRDVWVPGRFIAEGLLPPFSDSTPHKPNERILVLANTVSPLVPQPEQGKFPKTILRDWASEINNGSEYHAGGPVRMLLWYPHKGMDHVLPHTVHYRSRLALALEMTSRVEEIVSVDHLISKKRKARDMSVELMSGRQVVNRMKQAGITVPDGRQTNLYTALQSTFHSDAPNDGTDGSVPTLRGRDWHEELHDLQRRFEAGEFTQTLGGIPGERVRKLPEGVSMTPEFSRLQVLERNLRHIYKRTKVTEALLAEQDELDLLDLQACDPNLSPTQQATMLADLQTRKKELDARVEDTPGHHIRDEFHYFKHDRRAYRLNPPLLMWDHRTAEPLKAHTSEFYPQQGLSLLDIRPKPTIAHPIPLSQSTEHYALLRALWHRSSESVCTLDSFAPGAIAAISPQVPALTDPSRGGERDLRDLPICRLTPEMVHGITTAWFRWPFKPEHGHLLQEVLWSEYDPRGALA
ncbi:MAG: hypothetical protein Q9219_002821 [cf. Caloplaca sp. 3 TL-2023]